MRGGEIEMKGATSCNARLMQANNFNVFNPGAMLGRGGNHNSGCDSMLPQMCHHISVFSVNALWLF